MKIKGLFSLLPPKKGFLIVFVLLFLCLSASNVTAQGSSNLVTLIPGKLVYKVNTWVTATLSEKWDATSSWYFLNSPNGNFVFRAYSNGCGLEVITYISGNNQASYGAVFLADIVLAQDQKTRLNSTIDAHFSSYQMINDLDEQVKVYNCLLSWDRSAYLQPAYNFYLRIGDNASSCDDKARFYEKAAALNVSDQAKFLLSLVRSIQSNIGSDCSKINSQTYKVGSPVSFVPIKTETAAPTALKTPTVLLRTEDYYEYEDSEGSIIKFDPVIGRKVYEIPRWYWGGELAQQVTVNTTMRNYWWALDEERNWSDRIFDCFGTHCGVYVRSIGTENPYRGFVFLEDIILKESQKLMIMPAINNRLHSLQATKDKKPDYERLFQVYSGLMRWGDDPGSNNSLGRAGRIGEACYCVAQYRSNVPSGGLEKQANELYGLAESATSGACRKGASAYIIDFKRTPSPAIKGSFAALATATPAIAVAVLPSGPERDWGKDIGDILTFACLLIFIVVFVMGGIMVIIYWLQKREDEKRDSERNEKKRRDEARARGSQRYTALVAEIVELLKKEALSDTEIDELAVLLKRLEGLRENHPQSPAAGIMQVQTLYRLAREKKLVRSEK